MCARILFACLALSVLPVVAKCVSHIQSRIHTQYIYIYADKCTYVCTYILRHFICTYVGRGRLSMATKRYTWFSFGETTHCQKRLKAIESTFAVS